MVRIAGRFAICWGTGSLRRLSGGMSHACVGMDGAAQPLARRHGHAGVVHATHSRRRPLTRAWLEHTWRHGP